MTKKPEAELVATLDVEAWSKATPAQKRAAVAAFNAAVNERRKARGLPPLKKRERKGQG